MLPRKIINLHHENRLKNEGNILSAIKKIETNKNLNFLLQKRFSYIENNIKGLTNVLELGCGAGHSKKYIKQNIKISDITDYDFLDYKNIDAQNTGFEDNKFEFVISSNMIHHLPFPVKFFNEMHRILKKGGKLIIYDAHCSVLLQTVLILMRHEGFDFTKDVWSLEQAATDKEDLWSGNSAIPYLLFNNKDEFKKKLGTKFDLKYSKVCECLLFLNSGGVTSKTFYIPLNFFLLKIIKYLDKFLSSIFPNIFALAYKVVLEKK